MRKYVLLALLLVALVPSYASVWSSDTTTREMTIKEITVHGRRASVASSLDKKVYAISSNVMASGLSLLDAMRVMPGVTIDGEGKITLRGSDKVLILVDGRQSSLTGIGSQKGLDNIPASQIERIEIINNPSAKYDAAGMAGVINIIYKKDDRVGFNGDGQLSLGVGNFASRRDDNPLTLPSYKNNPKLMPSVNLNYKTAKVNAFASGNLLLQERLPNNEFTTRYYDDGPTISSQVAENRKQIHYNIKAGLDWQIDERNLITAFGIYDYEYHVDTSEVAFIDMATMLSGKNWSFREMEATGYANGTVIYKHLFPGSGHSLSASVQFTKGWEDEKYILFEKSDYRTAQDVTHVIAPEYTWLVNTDYTRSFDFGRLDVGAKGSFRSMPISYDVVRGVDSPIYEGLGNWSDWRENIVATYANVNFTFDQFDIEGGLRAEYTDVRYAISPDNIYYHPSEDRYGYFDLFPNIRFTFRLGDSHRLSLIYNSRIDRPSEAELRIFPKYDDPEMLKVGNPYLRPQYTQNVELGYRFSWNTGSIYVAGYHKTIRDAFTRIYTVDDSQDRGEVINKIYQNTGRAMNSGVEVVFDQTITKWWSINGSFNWYRNIINPYVGTLYFPYERPFTVDRSVDSPCFAKVNTNFSFWKGSQLQLSGVYFSAINQVQGVQRARGGLDFGFKKPFAKGRVELSLTATDILSTMGVYQTINGQGFSAIYENPYETQVVMVGCKFKF